MPAVGIKIYLGPNSSSLTLIDKSPTGVISIPRNRKLSERANRPGNLNVTEVGKNKRVFKLSFTYVPKSSTYITLRQFGLSARFWWCKMTNRLGTTTFEGFVFAQIDNEKMIQSTDTEDYFDADLIIKEI
jgi:hypothetical protein